ncbi:MAG: FAD-dependent oxidoreductase [Planctomycetota bacterium]
MAGHAKFLAVYDAPFWREQGLSGDLLSARGPLAEMHDATPNSGSPYALLGFIGLNGEARKKLSHEELSDRCLEHLCEMMGPPAANPTSTHLFDWSEEEFTAAPADVANANHHPEYGVVVPTSDPWNDKMQFIVTETAAENGGLIEGAISQGLCFAEFVLKQLGIEIKPIPNLSPCTPHQASMSWDWI